MVILELLSNFHFSERDKIGINSSSSLILQALNDLPHGKFHYWSALYFFRSIPPELLGRTYIGFDSDSSQLKQLEENGFK